MKNLVFYGDGLLCPPEGYGEAVIELLVTNRPRAAFKSFHSGEENLTISAALRGAPALIGKAPDLVVLGLGTVDVLQAVSTSDSLERLAALVQLLVLKTQTRVALTTICDSFLPAEARPAALAFNRELALMVDERVEIIELGSAVSAFLEDHRQGAGEKRALHLHPLKLTSTGRVFLSNTAYRLLGLHAVFPA